MEIRVICNECNTDLEVHERIRSGYVTLDVEPCECRDTRLIDDAWCKGFEEGERTINVDLCDDAREEGYKDGYSDGVEYLTSEVKVSYDEGYNKGYDAGYGDGHAEVEAERETEV